MTLIHQPHSPAQVATDESAAELDTYFLSHQLDQHKKQLGGDIKQQLFAKPLSMHLSVQTGRPHSQNRRHQDCIVARWS